MELILLLSAIFIVVYCSIAMAFASRADGGGEPSTPEIVERLVLVLPYSMLGLTMNPIAALLNLAAYAGRATGHGQYFPDVEGKIINPKNKEFVDPLVTLFFKSDPRVQSLPVDPETYDRLITDYGLKKLHIRCAVGMALTGLLVTIVPAITSAYFGHPLIAIALILSGLFKSAAYLISHHIFDWHTEGGEYLNGFQQGIIIFSSIAIMVASYIM